jgi:N-acetylmuramoyl-L-alanine amidase CwlA
MLGEKVVEEKGKVTSTRVLESMPQTKVETSFEAQGKILGIEHRTTGTYWSVIQPSGTLYGEGNGIAITKEGMATWKGSGAGKFTETGGVIFRGAIYYQTNAERLLTLNGLAVVFEYEVDENGNTKSIGFEWK